MLQRVSASTLIEAKHDDLAGTLRDYGPDIHRAELMSFIMRDEYLVGSWHLRSELFFVPDCLTTHITKHGRKPYQHDHG
jgi:hypothetical protein